MNLIGYLKMGISQMSEISHKQVFRLEKSISSQSEGEAKELEFQEAMEATR